jgi:hypothetical protein
MGIAQGLPAKLEYSPGSVVSGRLAEALLAPAASVFFWVAIVFYLIVD